MNFLIEDEAERVFLTSMVCCLFAREVYKHDVVADCFYSLAYRDLADNREEVA